jgi:hypothetical protein
MTHSYNNLIVCKNDFFKNPEKVLSLFDKQTYIKSSAFPGERTDNLLESQDPDTKNFALFFAQKLCDEIFPSIHKLMIDIRFHINCSYSNQETNYGWIHADDADLAGLVYMSQLECSLDTGTSIFSKNTEGNFGVDDFASRQEFNLTGISTEQYIDDLKNNHKTFTENVRVGNMYNRLIAYDAKLYHRPNRYNLDSKESRKSIVFFIKGYQEEHSSKINLNFNWTDL